MNTSSKYLVLAVVLTSSLFFSLVGFGQEIPDLSKVKVDELSNAQIESLLNRIEESGYSESQLELLARARGMSESDISKLRQRINTLRTNSGAATDIGVIERLRTDNTFNDQYQSTEPFDVFSDILKVDTVNSQNLRIFGLEFFRRSKNAFDPSLNIAPPSDYVLGPGDQLIVDVWGASQQSMILDISPQGSVFIQNVGPVYLNGYSLERAEARIIKRLKAIFSTLGESSFAQVSLGQIRTMTVNVVGEVQEPGAYQISSFGSALNALQLAGGPTGNGSFRKLMLFRNEKLEKEFDLYDLLLRGTGLGFKLKDQDVLFVPTYGARVTVDGAVKRPAIYESIEGESLSDVINFAGGFTENAYKRSISIRRNLENIKTVKTIEKENFSSFLVVTGDMVDVGEIQNNFQKRVRIEGAVNHPGEFEIKPNMQLSDAIAMAGGLRGDAYMERGLIIREQSNFELQSIAFSPKSLQEGSFNLELEEEDLIKIQSIFDLKEDFKLNIQGEVIDPGVYPFTEGMTVEDLIYLAGGFKESASKSFVEVARRVTGDDSEQSNEVAQIFNFAIDKDLLLSEEGEDFILQPFDLVVIRRSPSYEKQSIIEIEGEVIYPGKYALEKRDERISDVLSRAGGMTDFAYVSGATLIRRTEYFVENEDGVSQGTSIGARIRRNELRELFEKDTLVEASQQELKTQESIGIELERIIQDPGGVYDLILKEGDVLSIPRELQTVRVRGEALYPSTIKYKEGASFKYFASKAGGFSDQARIRKSYVIYANGSAQKTSSFLWFKKFPEIKPGSELIIPSKPIRRRLSPGEIISITTGLGTLAVIVNNLTN